MSIYLGQDKVGVCLYTVVDSANAEGLDTASIVRSNPFDMPADRWQDDEIEEWTRPAEWPNLDALPALDEGVYLTYDNRNVDYPWAGFYIDTGSDSRKIIIAQGHVEGNNWIEDSSQTVNRNTYIEINYGSATTDFVVFKIIPENWHFYGFRFGRIAAETLGTYAVRYYYDQYCLERKGNLPYINSLANSSTNFGYTTEWMECDNTTIGTMHKGNMNLSGAFLHGRKLRKINLDNWPTEQWNVTSLSNMFQHCNSIQELDLSNWKTTNWHVTAMNNMFEHCIGLKKLNVSTWDFTNWGSGSGKTLSLAALFRGCRSLEELDLSGWKLGHLNITLFNAAWENCNRLRKLNINNWDTHNWTVSRIDNLFYACNQLVDVDLSNWDTTNWTVTNMSQCWFQNYKRTNFDDIVNWNTSNWAVTNFSYVWDTCVRINKLDLSNWDVSNWRVTTMQNTWTNCRSMKELKLGKWTTPTDGWDTSQWVVTDIRQLFYNCWALQEFEIFKCDASNWDITNLNSAFYSCYYLTELDTKTWAKNKTWTLPSSMPFNYFCSYCYNLKKADLSNINVQNVTLANYGSNKGSYTSFHEDWQLKELTLPQNYKGYINLRYCYHLTRDALLSIFNQLGSPLSGAEIVLTEMRYKLTNADIAIATTKGYTVS